MRQSQCVLLVALVRFVLALVMLCNTLGFNKVLLDEPCSGTCFSGFSCLWSRKQPLLDCCCCAGLDVEKSHYSLSTHKPISTGVAHCCKTSFLCPSPKWVDCTTTVVGIHCTAVGLADRQILTLVVLVVAASKFV